MKILYFIRHAKSSWDDVSLDDHDRPLNKRGQHDGPVMARRLLGINVAPDGLLSSTAKRARQTASYFKDVLSVEDAIYLKKLYHAWPPVIEAQIRNLPEEWETVLVFGHNPGYTDLANQLQNDLYIGNVPTCGIIVAGSDVTEWKDFTLADAERIAYLYPKQTE
ncbi:MAG: phosphohistidine phosphatase [Neolewinella sp.]|jgi:phosphohistidine phosphatase